MQAIAQWAVSGCAAAAVCTAALMLVPNSAQERMMRITVSCFFLICVAMPLINLLPETETAGLMLRTDNTVSQAAGFTDELVMNEIKTRLEKSAAELLSEKGCEGFEVGFLLKEQNGRIDVSEIYLALDSRDAGRAAELSALFCRTYGCTPQVDIKENRFYE
ncbi:MAG: hypothetical protein IKS19_03795 [Clostridia bacterium]|nr:hypothetical protein [Clostridia bacterium]